MAYFYVPAADGQAYCLDACQHRDCAAWREQLSAPCRICRLPLLPGEKATYSPELVHFSCALAEAESFAPPPERSDYEWRGAL